MLVAVADLLESCFGCCYVVVVVVGGGFLLVFLYCCCWYCYFVVCGFALLFFMKVGTFGVLLL